MKPHDCTCPPYAFPRDVNRPLCPACKREAQNRIDALWVRHAQMLREVVAEWAAEREKAKRR